MSINKFKAMHQILPFCTLKMKMHILWSHMKYGSFMSWKKFLIVISYDLMKILIDFELKGQGQSTCTVFIAY